MDDRIVVKWKCKLCLYPGIDGMSYDDIMIHHYHLTIQEGIKWNKHIII